MLADGIVQRYRERPFAVRVLAFDIRVKRDHGQIVQVGEIVWMRGQAAPVEVVESSFPVASCKSSLMK